MNTILNKKFEFTCDEFENILNTPSNIRRLREHVGMSLAECAEVFDMSVRGWQKKEQPTDSRTHQKLSKIQFEYLLLLADYHPDFWLKPKGRKS